MTIFEQMKNDQINRLMPETSIFNMIEVEEFIRNNSNYVHSNGYNDRDLEIIMDIRTHIQQRAKASDKPLNGDAAHIFGRETTQYASARITENVYHGDGAVVFTQPMTPSVSHRNGKIYTSTSGGYFKELKIEDFQPSGTKSVMFWTWGRSGAGAHQGIHFTATVNNWHIENPDFY